MDLFKNFLGLQSQDVTRKDFLLLTNEFENTTRDFKRGEDVINLAKQVKNALKNVNVKLRHTDKINLLKTINRAKVRALLLGTPDGLKIYKDLDVIGSDILILI